MSAHVIPLLFTQWTVASKLGQFSVFVVKLRVWGAQLTHFIPKHW